MARKHITQLDGWNPTGKTDFQRPVNHDGYRYIRAKHILLLLLLEHNTRTR